MQIRIALADDEVVVRGVDAMLRPFAEQLVVTELPTDSAVPAEHVDVVLCDSLGQRRGHGREISDLVANPAIRRVAVYTWNFQPWLARQATEQGASGYLSKSLPAQELVNALVAIHDGKQVIAPTTEPRSAGGDWPGKDAGLTAREAEVLTLITQGYSNAEIADLTCLSINSIKSYIRSCYRKMGVTSRSRAVLWGIEHGLGPDALSITEEH